MIFATRLAKNATWILSGQGLQLAARFGYFVIVAHVLGPRGYGSFVACIALIGILAPFGSFGTGHVMIKYVARDRSVFPSYFGNALLVTFASGVLLIFLALLIRSRVLPASVTPGMLVAVGLGDLVSLQVSQICLQAFQVSEDGRRYSQFMWFSTAVRFLAAIVLMFSSPTAARWAYLYCGSGLISAVAGILAVSGWCARPKFGFHLISSSMREGFHFATSLASQSVYDDIDKTMLARLSTVESTAIYAAAYRVIEPSIVPIRSLGAASYPDFFRHGQHGVSSGFQFAKRILRGSVIYGLLTALGLFLAAGLLPLVLGHAYYDSAAALRWLCLLPAIKGVHIFLSDTLTGANYQWQTSWAQITVAVFNIAINFWIIRAFSWRGAAWSSLFTDTLLMLLLYLIIKRHLRRERRLSGPATRQAFVACGEQ